MKYYTAEGEEIESPSDDWDTYKSNVGVGGFAGTTASISASESTSTANIKFDQVTVRNMHIKDLLMPEDCLAVLENQLRRQNLSAIQQARILPAC